MGFVHHVALIVVSWFIFFHITHDITCVDAIHSLKQQAIQHHDMDMDMSAKSNLVMDSSFMSDSHNHGEGTTSTYAQHLIGKLDISKWDNEEKFLRKETDDEKTARLAIAKQVDSELVKENYLPFMTVSSDDSKEVAQLFTEYCKINVPELLLLKDQPLKARIEIFTQNIKMIQQLNVRTHYWASQDKTEPFYAALTSLAYMSEDEWLNQYTYETSPSEKQPINSNNRKPINKNKQTPIDNKQTQIIASQRLPAISVNFQEMSASAHAHRRTMLERLKHQAQHTSLTRDEQQQLEQVEQAVEHETIHGVGVPPADWDWRGKGVLAPVQNQGKCGICWAFSSIGCVESVLAIQNYAGQYSVNHNVYTLQAPLEASISNAVSCSSDIHTPRKCGGNGVKEGNRAATLFIQARGTGICQRNAVGVNNYDPKNPTFQPCDTSCTRTDGRHTGVAHPPLHIDDFEVNAEHNEAWMVWDVYRQPVDVSITSCWRLAFAGWGIFSNPVYTKTCKKRETNHAVMIVGYGVENNVNYWIMKNSWGTRWGKQGYLKIARGNNLLKIDNLVSYPIVKAPNPAIARLPRQYAYIGGMAAVNSPVSVATHFTNAPFADTALNSKPDLSKWSQAADESTWVEHRDGVYADIPRYLNQWTMQGVKIPPK